MINKWKHKLITFLIERVYLSKKLNFFIYRYRFLIVYIFFCGFAIVCEIALIHFFRTFHLLNIWVYLLAIFTGIYIAYFFNVNFNFHVPKAKRKRAISYFIIISFLSISLNQFLRSYVLINKMTYEEGRVVISGLLFIFAYILHRKFSFSDYKKVGVAIYANGFEDVDLIYEKIKFFSDFLHIDIVDKTFRNDVPKTNLSQLINIRQRWPNKEIHVHVMSTEPEKYFPQFKNRVDLVCFHIDIPGDNLKRINNIKSMNSKVAVCITPDSNLNLLDNILDKIDMIMLLSISTPGYSGQAFIEECYNTINIINKLPKRDNFTLCVDGGLNENNISSINAEYVVSGSSVLNSNHPRMQIMKLQTSCQYE